MGRDNKKRKKLKKGKREKLFPKEIVEKKKPLETFKYESLLRITKCPLYA